MARDSVPSAALLRRGIRRGLITVRRERGWVTALGALTGVLLVLQLLAVVAVGVQGADHLLRTGADLRIEIKDGAQDTDVQRLFGDLQRLPIVASVAFVSADQMLERQRAKDPQLIAFVEQLHLANPFRDTLSVQLRSLDDYDAFADFVRSPERSSIVDPAFLSQATDQEHQIREMLRLTQAGETVVFVFLGVLGTAILFVLVELVRRRSLERREELFVERISGAREIAMLVPFFVECGVLLIVAFLLSIVVLVGILLLVPGFLQGAFPSLASEISPLLMLRLPIVCGVEFLLLPFLALLGAWLGMRPFLRHCPHAAIPGL